MSWASWMRCVRVCAGACALVGILAVAAFAESVRVKVDRTSVWGNTTGTAGVIGVVRRGEILEVLGHEGRWLLVVLPSDARQKGYVLARQTETVDDAEHAAAPASGGAQPRPAQRPGGDARPRAPKPPPYLYVGITGQASSLAFTGSDSVTTLLEPETRTTKYTPSRRPGFEFAVGEEVYPKVIVSATLVQAFGPGTASISAQIPHPIFYATPRPLTGATTARRVETALHIDIASVVHRSPSYTLTVGAGPSVFFLKQDLIDQLKYTEAYPYDTVTFTGASLSAVSATAFGAHLQTDFVKPFTRKISWQASGRYSYGQAKLTIHSTTIESKTGQAQVSGGIRLSF